jgi:alpha,alpha-trehalase
VVFAWVLARVNRKESWSIFQKALSFDLYDSPLSTTSEGIHLGAMAGTVDIMQRCYTGLRVKEQCLYLEPSLPDELKKLVMHIKLKGNWLSITITPHKILISSEIGAREPSYVFYKGHNYKIAPAQTINIDLEL